MALTAEQLEARRSGIGSSEAGAVLGVNPWRTPLDVWREKVNGASDDADEPSEAAHFGNVLEQVVANEYTRRTGQRVRRVTRTLRHPEHPFMLAHLDRTVVGEKCLLECKTAGTYSRDKWGPSGAVIDDAVSDDAPAEYIAQVHHQMLVRGVERADMAVLIGGQDFRIYHLRLDPAFAKILLEIEAEFWHGHVETEIAPPPTTLEDVALLFEYDDGSTITADTTFIEQLGSLKRTKTALKELDDDRKQLELAVKAQMGKASVLTDPDGKTLATWKTQTARRIDQQALRADMPEVAEQFTRASEYRVLRLK